MKKALLVLFTVVVCAFGGLGVEAQEPARTADHKPVLGVKTFESSPACPNSAVSDSLTDLFTTELMKTGRYRVVEREGLDNLIDEIEFGQSLYSDKDSALRKGFFEGIEYLFIARVTNFGERVHDLSIPLPFMSMVGRRSTEATVRLDFRIVDATTREIVYAGYGEGLDKSSGVALVAAGTGAVDVNSRSFLNSKLGRATIGAIQDAIAKLDQSLLGGRVSGAARLAQLERARQDTEREDARRAEANLSGVVLAITRERLLVVSLGTKHGVRPGDTLRAFRQDTVTDSKGIAVYTEERQVGTLTVVEVQADRAKASIVSGGDFAEGYVVRK